MQSPDPDLLRRRPVKRSAQLSSARLRQQGTNDTAFYPFPTSLGPPAPIYTHNGPGHCRLPLDVLSVIIGYLWESPADLATVSRVSRIMHYLVTPLLYREVRLRGAGPRAKGRAITTSAQGGEGAESGKGKKRKRDSGDSGDEFGFSVDADADAGGSENGMSVFLVGLATLQRSTVSKVVRKLVLEGELEVGSFGNINGSSTGAESIPGTLNWSESDGMFGLAIGGTVGSLTDLQELR